MPPVLSKPVSNNVRNSQRRHAYIPARRSRANKFSKDENSKFEAALDNSCDPYGWLYTSNGRVFPEKKPGEVAWRLCVRRVTNPKCTKTTEKKSGGYSTQ